MFLHSIYFLTLIILHCKYKKVTEANFPLSLHTHIGSLISTALSSVLVIQAVTYSHNNCALLLWWKLFLSSTRYNYVWSLLWFFCNALLQQTTVLHMYWVFRCFFFHSAHFIFGQVKSEVDLCSYNLKMKYLWVFSQTLTF